MEKTARKLITIITESVIEDKIIRAIEQLGARGYTVLDARGKGSRGVRDAGYDMSANVRIESVVDEATADAIIDHLNEHYFTDYAITCFVSDVDIFRPQKF